MKIPYIEKNILLKTKEEFNLKAIDMTKNRALLINYLHENLVIEKEMTNQPNKKEKVEKKLVIKSFNLFIFIYQMIIDYFSSGSKFRRFYRFKDEAKLPIEEQTNNAQNMDTPNF
jgi:hypothetical protein